jgi:tyrosyl-tRNA synthetase
MGFFSKAAKPAARNSAKLSEVLKERGYVYQHSAPLEEITDGPKRTLYLGIDPTADSMHVGHLQAMLVLRRFLENGHKVIVLLGGGTGMIGDPSGKSEERVLLDEATLARNARGVRAQATNLFESGDFRILNNLDWLGGLKVIEFLRDIGKHFSVNAMMARDSVKDRLEHRDQGISYTEFSYMLLQSYDFLHLFEHEHCDLQLGASDQWGNMVSGVDLIRRKTSKMAYALSFPLLVNKSTGKKFGKSEGGAIWLDAQKTSPFEFYQFWFNTSDDEAQEYLLKMTLVPKADIDAVMKEQSANPAARAAQKKLAYEVTKLVHGEDEAKAARDFENVPTIRVGRLRDVMEGYSVSELRRLVEQGGVSSVTSGKIHSVDYEVKEGEEIRIGKSKVYKVWSN